MSFIEGFRPDFSGSLCILECCVYCSFSVVFSMQTALRVLLTGLHVGLCPDTPKLRPAFSDLIRE